MSPNGAHFPHQKSLDPLCPSCPYILGTSLQSARFHIQEGVWGKCPLPSPSTGADALHQKMHWSIVPSFLCILGTSLQSARFHIPEGVWMASAPYPDGRPCPPPENVLIPCALFLYILGTLLKSARFYIPERVWGQVPCPPHGCPCPTENALVPCAPLVHKSWVRH